MSPRSPRPVGIAVAPHVSGAWTWSLHTLNGRWRGADATASDVGSLAQTLLEQVHAQIGTSAIVAAPAAVPGLDNTGHAEPDLAAQARALAAQAHTDLASGHFRTLDLRRLPADAGRLAGPEWTLTVHAISDEAGADWAWVSGGGWYATGSLPLPVGEVDQVARAGIEHAASVSPLGGRVRVVCDDREAVTQASMLAQAAHRERLRLDPMAVPELEFEWIAADSTPEHTVAMDLCEQAADTPTGAASPPCEATLPESRPAEPVTHPDPALEPVRAGTEVVLRPEQHAAVTEIVRLWERDGLAQLRWPCGYGKTLTYAGAALAVNAPLTAVVVTTLELVEQIAHTWQTLWGPRLDQVIAVCSDQEILDADQAPADAHDRPLSVITDPDLLVDTCTDTGPTLIVVTYQSLHVLLKACANGLGLRVLVADEAHHTAGPDTSEWTRVHHIDALRLYGTATPRRLRPPADGPRHYSMDDPDVFGQVAAERTFGQGIAEGRLADYQVIASLVDHTQILNAIRDRQRLGAEHTPLPADLVAAQISVLDAIAAHDLRSLICFAPTLAWARVFTATLTAHAALLGDRSPDRDLVALHINATSPTAARTRARTLLGRPGEQVVIVTVVGCFAEGVDVAGVDAVGLFSKTGSPERLLQQIGRALRKGDRPDKIARLITPIYTTAPTGPDTDVSSVLEESSYASLAQVLRALRSVDARFDAAVRTHLRTGHGLERWVRPYDHGTGPVPVGAGDLAEAISTVLLPDLTSAWWRNFELCRQAVRVHGTLRVADLVTITGTPMRWWLQRQRRLRSLGLLIEDQVAALTGIGMVWDTYKGRFWDRLVTEVTRHRNQSRPGDDAGYSATLNYARQLHRDGHFTTEQLAWLAEHDIDLDPRYTERSRRITELGEFLTAQQRLPDPRFTAQEERLARYAQILRGAHRDGTLHPDHITLCRQWKVPLAGSKGSRIPPPAKDRYAQVVGDLAPNPETEALLAAIVCGATNTEIARATGLSADSHSARLTRRGHPTLGQAREQALASQAAWASSLQDLVAIARRFQVTPSRVARLASAPLRSQTRA